MTSYRFHKHGWTDGRGDVNTRHPFCAIVRPHDTLHLPALLLWTCCKTLGTYLDDKEIIWEVREVRDLQRTKSGISGLMGLTALTGLMGLRGLGWDVYDQFRTLEIYGICRSH